MLGWLLRALAASLHWAGLDCSLSGYSFPLARHHRSCLGDNGMFALFTYILLFGGIDALPFLLIFPWRGLKIRSVAENQKCVFWGPSGIWWIQDPINMCCRYASGLSIPHHAVLDVNMTTCMSRDIKILLTRTSEGSKQR